MGDIISGVLLATKSKNLLLSMTGSLFIIKTIDYFNDLLYGLELAEEAKNDF